ncbi:unnamed protein product [Caenorhabditis angaria]|uniref:Alanine--tRNA ligase n=1 Tax=Caenorhabditis angaria TaxID=860376 RepID=A0A9P1I9L5_9PELO|nr:unnamed protein product [Caenorhabditis angaria]
MQRVRIASRSYYTHLELRKSFLDYFAKNEHKIVASSSVIPPESDKSLLFTNAGMNQFKGKILSPDKLSKTEKIANIQKCIRAGGKHNDLDDVGKDVHHQTFFEMMGNWSFNDAYSKREACELALTYLVENLKIDPDRLYFSYFAGDSKELVDADLECRDIWRDLGVRENKIVGFGRRENFWEMGASGPCGVCTEIHYDRVGGGRDAEKLVNSDDSVVEIWNIVFMSKLRLPNGRITSLGKNHIDTGMGFERLLSIIQGQSSNFDTDVFTKIISEIRNLATKTPPNPVAIRIVADHLRAICVALADGARPSGSDAGFVVRKMMRRAFLNAGNALGIERFAFGADGGLVDCVGESLGVVYPEILENLPEIRRVLREEEEQFWRVVDQGKPHFLRRFEIDPNFSGKSAFYLLETHGLPLEITEELAREHGKSINLQDFEQAKLEARNLSKTSAKTSSSASAENFPDFQNYPTHSDRFKYDYEMIGSDELKLAEVPTKILDISRPIDDVDLDYRLILENCQFYGEQGGQASDSGFLLRENTPIFRVKSAKKSRDKKLTILLGEPLIAIDELKQIKAENLEIDQKIDEKRRIGMMRAHSATHLLHHFLKRELGNLEGEVEQKGSSVENEYLRFDYSTGREKIPNRLEILANVQNAINQTISQGLEAKIRIFAPNEELARNLKIDRIGEAENIRVVGFDGGIAEECCSGTHVTRSSQILDFQIMSDKSSAKGIRRITAICGEKSRENRKYLRNIENIDENIDWKQVPLLEMAKIKELFKNRKSRVRLNK